MTVLTGPQVLALAVGAGFNRAEAETMTVIAFYESGWNPRNVGDASLSRFGSRGLWQIFTKVHSPQETMGHGGDTWTDALITTLEDPAVNARAARVVYNEQGFRAWSTYNNLHNSAHWAALLNTVRGYGAPATSGGGSVTVRDAIAWIKSPPAYVQVDHGAPGECLKNVRHAFNIPAMYGSAAAAAAAVPLFAWSKRGQAPRNRPFFYTGGSHGFGHITITDGYTKVGGNLRVWTTDWPSPVTGKRDGKWRRVRANVIAARWGLKPVGWSNELNGVKITI